MAETLLSVGLDVGTTSTQMIASRLTVENQASGFTVPELQITGREILYESPVHFTPLLDESRIDGDGVRKIVEKEYALAGIRPEQVDTGAVIITGETSRKENAGAVLQALSEFAGRFVVATAGPDLESRLSARGAGAVDYSLQTGKTVLHMDIGGGTSNLSLIREGEIVDTGCLNVGGRLVAFDDQQVIQWVSPGLQGIFSGKPGERVEEGQLDRLAETLAQVLEMAAGLRQPEDILTKLITREGKLLETALLEKQMVISFSGGVADCIAAPVAWKKFGDLGPKLGSAIRKSRLCRGPYRLGSQTIRATVIGAGCHAAQLSGSTVYYQNVRFPLKDVPAVSLARGCPVTGEAVRSLLARQEGPAVLTLAGEENSSYQAVSRLADQLAEGFPRGPVYLCLRQDMAKALGQALALRLGRDREILCIDRVALGENTYLDVGGPVGPAIPVVVKTLILGKQKDGIAHE